MTQPASLPASPTRIGGYLPAAYFGEMEEAFRRAEKNAGSARDVFLDFDGLILRLHWIGDSLPAQLLPTLAHLQVPDQPAADYTICCWDDQATGSVLPPPTEWMMHGAQRSILPILTNERFQTFYVGWLPSISAIDLESRTAYCCYVNASSLLMYEVSGPLRGILNAILNRRGMQITHASAVGNAKGSLIFAGAPFSGKSTLSVLALQDGLNYQADDLCVVTEEPQPRSLCLYNIAKVRQDMRPAFPELDPVFQTVQEEGESKSFFYVHQQAPERLMKSAPIRAVILPRIVDAETSHLEPAALIDTVRALVSYTVSEIPMAPGRGEQILIRALGRLPAWHLHVGRDNRQTLRLIRSLLDGDDRNHPATSHV